MHPGGRRCSSLAYAGYARSSRLAGRAPRHPELAPLFMYGPQGMTFSVVDKNVTVVGGGRSGVAAAELLVSRGARVTLADTDMSMRGRDELVRLGVTVALG